MTEKRRITFQLERDEDGYPPSDHERLWATPTHDGHYLIENIPFFIMGISSGDEVSVQPEAAALLFDRLIKPSGASTFRLAPSDLRMSASIRADVEALGCSSEYNQNAGLIAVEVPGSISIQPFLTYITEKLAAGLIDVEEAALRHDVDALR